MKNRERIKEEFKVRKLTDAYKEKVKLEIYDKVHEMTYGRAYLNILIYEKAKDHGFFGVREEGVFLYDVGADIKSAEVYFDRVKDALFKDGLDINKIRFAISTIREVFAKFSLEFDNIKSHDVSMYDIVRMCMDSKEMESILCDNSFDESLSAFDAIDIKNELGKKVTEYVVKNNIQPYSTFIKAKTALRIPQFVDIMVGVGVRGDNDDVYENIVRESWLIGIRTPESFFIENDVSTNALIVQKMDIRSTGTWGKRGTMLSHPNYLHKDPNYRCDSVHYIPETITEDNFHYFVSCYIYDANGDIKIEESMKKELVGKTIRLRNPITCNSTDGICRHCVGDKLYFDNVEGYGGTDMHIGIANSLDIISPIKQAQLSYKHNTEAKLVAIEVIDGDGVIINDYTLHHTDHITFTKNYKEIKFTELIQSGKYILSKSIMCTKGKDTDDITSNLYFKIHMDDININDGVVKDISKLRVKLQNKPKTSGFQEFTTLFGGKVTDRKEFLDRLRELLYYKHPILVYMLARMLFRDKADPRNRPDFSKPEVDIEIQSIQKTIQNFPELSIKLSMGYFTTLIADPDNYIKERTKGSKFDVLFKSRNNKGGDNNE